MRTSTESFNYHRFFSCHNIHHLSYFIQVLHVEKEKKEEEQEEIRTRKGLLIKFEIQNELETRIKSH